MIKHTKSPWKIKGQDIIGNEENGYICTWSGKTADAQLIASAPELLEFMKDTLQYKNRLPEVFVKRVEQMIAKAEGAC